MEPKGNSIELSMFLKYGLTEMKKSSIADVRHCSKDAFVNITFHLIFFVSLQKVYSLYKVNKIVQGFS